MQLSQGHPGVGRRLFCLLVGLVIILAATSHWPSTPVWAQSDAGTIIDDATALDPGEVLRVEDGELRQIAFSPDEAILAVATGAGLWVYAPSDTSNGQVLTEDPVQALWWAADGTLLAATLDDGSLQLWQMTDQELLGAVDGLGGAIVSVAWSPDANQIATGSADGVIEIWSVSEGVVLETLEGHTGAILNLYWIADGSQIVSAAEDGSVRVWGVEVAAPPTPTVAITPTPTPRPVFATVGVDRLNVRSGPGTDFERVGTGLRGEQLAVLDHEEECAWLQVRTPGGLEGWVAGGAQFVTLDTPCGEIGVMPSVPPATPTAPASSSLPTPTAAPAQPTPAATPTAASGEQPAEELTAVEAPPTSNENAAPSAGVAAEAPVDPFPPEQGCYLFQNGLPVALTLNIAASAGDFTQTIDLLAGEEAPHCFEPGRYTYVIRYQIAADTGPAEVPGEFTVRAGDRFMFPIRPQ